jgi:uncharacterized LabA/DUF88 family protein
MPPAPRRIAVLFDAENISHRIVPDLLAAIEQHGSAVIRRAYADWTSPAHAAWKPLMTEFAIRPVTRFPNGGVAGKNATDIALAVDAMDMLHTMALEGICIASSDSDFADLALRIREAGLMAIGIGRYTTPERFRKSCTLFIPTNAAPPAREAPAANAADASVQAYRLALARAADLDDGWARMTDLGSAVPKALRVKLKWLRKQPGFGVAKRKFKGKEPDVDCVRLREPGVSVNG